MSSQIPAPPAAPPTGEPSNPPTGEPAKKPIWKRWWFWVGGVVVLLIAATALGGGAKSPSNAGGNNGAKGGTTENAAGIGDPVGDGQFTFTVHNVKCGQKSIGSGILKSEAQGEYCLVNMTVENTGNESQLMDSSNQYMYIGDKQYSTSSDATLALNDSQNFFLKEINPGNTVDGVMVFDIPAGGQPDRLELHDSIFSGGVTVNI